MNSYFRRDYLYQLDSKSNGLNSILRYVSYDRKNKEYLFAETDRPLIGEIMLRIPKSNVNAFKHRLTKLKHIGYENTDLYQGKLGLSINPKLVTRKYPKKVIKKEEFFEVGSRYSLTQLGNKRYFFNSSGGTDDLTLVKIKNNMLTFRNNIGVEQILLETSLKDFVIEKL